MLDRTTIDGALGKLGLLLIALTGWAAVRVGEGSRTGALVARLVLGGITAVGWAVDRLHPPGPDRGAPVSSAGTPFSAHEHL